MGERDNLTDVYRQTHAEAFAVRARFVEPINDHQRRVTDSRAQAGLEVLGLIQEYVASVRVELPDELRVHYRLGGGTFPCSVDLNLNDWSLMFAGAQRRVDSASLGEFWFEQRDAFLGAIENRLMSSREIYLR